MTSEFSTRFREELVTAIAQPARRRRNRRRGLVGAAAASAGLLGVLSLLGPDTAHADVRITRDRGRVEVLLTDLESSADDVQRAVTDAGLDVVVESAPVGPSHVGRFVGNTSSGSGLVELQHVGETDGAFMGFSIPDDWLGTLVIFIGRAATTSESYMIFSDAYAPGEPLAGTCTLGRPLDAAADDLDDLAVTVRGAPGSGPGSDLAEALRTEQAGWDIASAYALSDTHLLVTVSPTPVAAGTEPC